MLIYKVEEGVFYAYLYLRSGEMILRIDSRTSDAIALALRMGVSIFIYEDVLDAACIQPNFDELPQEKIEENAKKKSLHSLKEALQKAIETEDYEQAAHLRDQINQLKAS